MLKLCCCIVVRVTKLSIRGGEGREKKLRVKNIRRNPKRENGVSCLSIPELADKAEGICTFAFLSMVSD